MTPERVAIVGTAQSWRLTPWNDPGLFIASLNDAFQLKGFQRADMWFDTHPLDHLHLVDKAKGPVFAHTIPIGYYVRPLEYLDWLGAQSIPIVLNPDYRTQYPKAAEWAHARPYPRAEVTDYFGGYFTSTPALMMAFFMMQGVRDFSIYGIHLATEQEYVEQRPCFEFFSGRILGPGKCTVTVKDKMRHYETADGHLALPVEAPVLASNFVYSFDTRPRAALEPLKWEAHKIAIKRNRALVHLRTASWWQPLGKARAELAWLDAWGEDVQEQMARVQIQAGA